MLRFLALALFAPLLLFVACSNPVQTIPPDYPAILSVPSAYETIAAAIEAAEEGDRIVLDEGIYVEDVVLPAEVTLMGHIDQSPLKVEIEGTVLVENSSADACLQNLKISSPAGSALTIVNSDIQISHCWLTCEAGIGLTIIGSSASYIAECTIDSCQIGVKIRDIDSDGHWEESTHGERTAARFYHCNFMENGGDNFIFDDVTGNYVVGASYCYWGVAAALVEETILDAHDGIGAGYVDTRYDGFAVVSYPVNHGW